MTGALHGIRVVDFTHVLAGPATGFMLALLGADVVKLERPARGDAMRHRGGTDHGAQAAGMSTAYRTQGAAKRSLALDLETAEGRAIAQRLLAASDVLVENHRPSTLARLGLDEAATRAAHPRLIHCAMTGYGRGHAMSDAAAYDINVQAVSGLMSLTGTAEGEPTRTGAPVMDYAAALAAGFAISAALLARERTGEGAFVDVSMLETAFTLMSSTIADLEMTGAVPRRRGNAANSRSVGAGVFPCAQGHLSLGVNEAAQFAGLSRGLGRPDWLADPRYAEPGPRAANAEAFLDELRVRLLERPAEAWEAALAAEGVPAAALRDLPAALALPPVAARGYLRASPGGPHPGLPFRIGDDPRGALAPPPALGADGDAILADLGVSAEEAAGLRARGVLG